MNVRVHAQVNAEACLTPTWPLMSTSMKSLNYCSYYDYEVVAPRLLHVRVLS